MRLINMEENNNFSTEKQGLYAKFVTKRALLILGSILIVLALFVSLLYLFKNNLDKNGSVSATIVSTSPSNKQQGVGIYSNILIRFSKALNTPEQNLIKIQTEPAVASVNKWVTPQVFEITLTAPMESNQIYTITVTGTDKPYSFKFTTLPIEKTSTEDQAKIQSKADKENADYWKSVNSQYPWYNKLPLQSANYYVYFDLNKYMFIAKLYPQKSSSIPTDAQVEFMKTEILSKLQQIGVDTKTAPIEYDVKEE